ncbi:metal-dependent hydrolase [Peribacillus sp. R9-11]|uniref:metal-dependent hydrolase n=1 Tax=Peribacillus sp. R9-11 TaxID=3073271 RepID=UPI0028689C81|nr:metal-dependent hydrolase [Peribacillus sp. R9-11]WMX58529.1 metal-dependent hydrolase [Peribacillus sp. R9-11]
MQYRTHFTTSLVVALPIMAATNTLTIGSVLAVGLGAVFPDIDEPHSWIGCRTRGISDVLNKVFGHRGITHSLAGIFVVFLTVALMIGLTDFKAIIGLYFILGYILHIVEDSFSKSGVKWLIPLSEHSFQSGMGVVWYRTGSIVENFIFLGSILILILQIKTLDFNIASFTGINLTGNLENLINQTKSFIGR